MRPYLNEKALFYRIQKGDTDAFGELYDFYSEKLYRFLYLKLPTAHDAEDITADSFLRTWQYLREGKQVTSMQAFLYQTARNLVVDFYRKRGGITVEPLDDYEVVIADRVDLTLEEKMALKGDMASIEEGLRKIKDSFREVIVLHYLNELSIKEISRIVGKSSGATRVMLHRGIKTLKTVLSESVVSSR